ncbi:hypothetical protein HY837_05940 [archaeon]|nr:hypothetical protein [archaeon]
MKEDLFVIGMFCAVVLVALALIFSFNFSFSGQAVKSMLEENSLKLGSIAPLETTRVEILNITTGPQEKLYIGQNFELTVKLKITGIPEDIRVKIEDCPLQGNLEATTENELVVFDVFSTKQGVYSCNANLVYQTSDGKQVLKKQFTLPVYSGESQTSIMWLLIGMVILLIVIHVLKYDFKKRK